MLIYSAGKEDSIITTSRLKKFQLDLSIPTSDLSRMLGVSKQMIYYWREFGIRNWTTAKKIAKKLNCSVEEIIGMVQDENIY